MQITASNYSDPADTSPEHVPSWLVCTPYYGNPDLEHLECYEALWAMYPELRQPLRGRESGSHILRIKSCAYIDMARAAAAAKVLELGADGVFFIDHDIIFNPPEVIGMMRAAERERAIVYSLYSMRQSGRRAIGGLPSDVTKIECHEKGGLYPGDYGGLGFAAIPRFAIEQLGADMLELETGWCKVKPIFALRTGFPDWPELFEGFWSQCVTPFALRFAQIAVEASGGTELPSREDARTMFASIVQSISDRDYHGEDNSFFLRAKRAGIRLLCDTRPRIYHKGAYRFALEDVQLAVPRARSLTVRFQPPNNGKQRLEAVGAPQFEMLEDTRA
jgi:hypothetical protein